MTGLHADHGKVGESPQSEVQERFARQKFVVYVSTIEIRKNHALLVNVWRRLLEERGSATPHLLFIGRSLWRGDEVVDSIKRDEKLRNYVHVLHDVNDRDLDWLYRNCVLTLYPSLYEGWGLPVAESLSYGKLCIASDRTATREIAPHLTELADPLDFRAWRDRVAHYLDNPDALARAEEKIRREYAEHTWDESIRQIISTLDALPKPDVKAAFLFPCETVQFFAAAQSGQGRAVCAGGWGNPEQGGRWSIGPKSKLAFRYAGKHDQFVMRLRLRALTRPGEQTRSVRIRINGQTAEVYDLSGTPSVIDLAIPMQRADGAAYSDNEIVFEPLELFSPSMISGSADARMLGIYVIAAQVADEPSSLSAEPVTPPSVRPPPSPSPKPPTELLKAAGEMVTLPSRFTGRRPLARLARATGFDRLWLRIHARRFRRAYGGIALIIDYLQREKRT
jgi:hypothetical protein